MNLFEEYKVGVGNPLKKTMEQVLVEIQNSCLSFIKEGEVLPYKLFIQNIQDMSAKELETVLCANNIVAECIVYAPISGYVEMHVLIKEFTEPKKKVEVKANSTCIKSKKEYTSYKKSWFNDGFNHWG